MKRLAVTCLAITAFAVGCEKKNNASQQLDRVQEKSEAVAQDLQDYAYPQKAEFVAKMQTQLDEINRELTKLGEKVESSSDTVKAEARPKLQVLRDKMAKLRLQLDAAKNADESAWDDVKSGFKKGYGELKEGFNTARQWMSEKIEP